MTRLQLLRRRLGFHPEQRVRAEAAEAPAFSPAPEAEGRRFDLLGANGGRIIHE
ncbi:hypothetical protein [Sphingomonas abietis]|uniref:Uncharacterized protein n=1 Tax=Sphingomonas abietis TaxID=3012344 RepID=A0ABY7NM20_9SPHN|nr:hypothetical protein [Sphingomonas abietis]WBO21673.1 hypothetical protein PBT88_16060 [Sphingomonas abietis]